MQSWHWAILFRPFGALILFGGIICPLGCLILKLLPRGRLQRLLATEMTRPTAPLRNRVIATFIFVGAFVALFVYGTFIDPRR